MCQVSARSAKWVGVCVVISIKFDGKSCILGHSKSFLVVVCAKTAHVLYTIAKKKDAAFTNLINLKEFQNKKVVN